MKDLRAYPYGQYKNDIFNKLDFDFEAGRKLLDVGCGDATDMEIFTREYGLEAFGIDIDMHENVEKPGVNFKRASVLDIPFENESFDYVYAHDVLHHIDEEGQGRGVLLQSLE